jgi:hypothetical protein
MEQQNLTFRFPWGGNRLPVERQPGRAFAAGVPLYRRRPTPAF